MLVLGGTAKLWGYTNSWDQLVENVVAVARAHGIHTTTGEDYFSLFEQEADRVH